MMIIDNKYEIGQTVYLITDKDQEARVVHAFKVFRSEILYCLCCGTMTSEHYDFELSDTKNILADV